MDIYCTPIKLLLPSATVSILGRISKVLSRRLRVVLVRSDGETSNLEACKGGEARASPESQRQKGIEQRYDCFSRSIEDDAAEGDQCSVKHGVRDGGRDRAAKGHPATSQSYRR
jgi:hypothetical protein